MLQIRSQSTSIRSSSREALARLLRLREHRRELRRVEVALVEQLLGGLDDRRHDPRPADDAARRADGAVARRARRSSRISSASFAAPASASRRLSIGVEPACAAWPRPGDPPALDAERAEHGAEREVQRLEHRPLLDVELEVGGRALELRARLERAVEVDAVRARARRAARRRRGRSAARSSSWSAIEPRRGGRAEERAAEARALLVGPVDEPDGDGRRRPPRRSGAAPRPPATHVEAAVEPAAVRDRVDVPADQHGALRRRRGASTSRCPACVALDLERQAVEQLSASHARAASQVSVQATRCAPSSSPVSARSSRESRDGAGRIERHGRRA